MIHLLKSKILWKNGGIWGEVQLKGIKEMGTKLQNKPGLYCSQNCICSKHARISHRK